MLKPNPETQPPAVVQAGLPAIPLHEIAAPGDLLRLEPERLAALLAAAERRETRSARAMAGEDRQSLPCGDQ